MMMTIKISVDWKFGKCFWNFFFSGYSEFVLIRLKFFFFTEYLRLVFIYKYF